jgi:hypothetical protein
MPMTAAGPEPTVIVVSPRPVPAPAVQDALVQAVKVAFGLVAVGLGVALRAAGENPATSGRRGAASPVMDAADVLVGTAWGAARLSGRVAVGGARVARPLVSFAAHPPLVPRRFQPGNGVQGLVQRWQQDRPDTVVALGSWTSAVLPGAVEAAMSQVDVERLVTLVLQRVDLTRVSSTVIDSIDLDRVVGEALDGMDLDPLVAGIVGRLDIEAVATEALQQVDLTEIVLKQVDLIRVAEYVVQGIDLPEIIRESTGTVASEAVRGLRMQGVDADQAVARIADRLLRRHRRHTADDLIPPQAQPTTEPQP